MAKTFKGFCLVYLAHYFQLPPGIFHDDLMGALSNRDLRFIDILGFRGSAKSTLASLALPLWGALEKFEEYPFIIPVADTGLQAAINIANIKYELDTNLLIKQDYGNIEGEFVQDWDMESDEEWQAKNMLLSNGVRVLARSRGQKIRGLRHRQHRPKLVIADDVEDLEWVRKKENRDKTERWIKSEVIPGMDPKVGRLIVIGNQLHTDALMARLRKNPSFTHIEIPIVEEKAGRKIFYWPAMYPDDASLKKLEETVGATVMLREYKLKAVAEEGQEVCEEWLRYYDDLPAGDALAHGAGVDLAISKSQTADYTAMVSGSVIEIDGVPKIYIDPNPIHAKLSFHETMETAKALIAANPYKVLYVEEVNYQKAAVQEAERALLPVMPMKAGVDKRSRLKVAATYIQNGTVIFPRTGCEDLLIELLGFGVEAHDDLVDAVVYLILGLVQNNFRKFECETV